VEDADENPRRRCASGFELACELSRRQPAAILGERPKDMIVFNRKSVSKSAGHNEKYSSISAVRCVPSPSSERSGALAKLALS
jgi:hypothetical protein